MSNRDNELKKLLERTALTSSLSVLMLDLTQKYPEIGEIEMYKPVWNPLFS